MPTSKNTQHRIQELQREISMLRARLGVLDAETLCLGKENAAAGADAGSTAGPHRLTLRVPQADATAKAWWDAQDDPSASVRHLIRADIAQHGCSDPLTRPIEAPNAVPSRILGDDPETDRKLAEFLRE